MKTLRVKKQHQANVNRLFISRIPGILLMRSFTSQNKAYLQDNVKDFTTLVENHIASLSILFHSDDRVETVVIEFAADKIVVIVRDKRVGNLAFEQYFEEVKECEYLERL